MSGSGCLIDTNVWVALAFSTHSHHHHALEAFAQCSSESPAIFCRATQQSFLRIATTPVIQKTYGAPSLNNHDAWVAFEVFLAIPSVMYRGEPEGIVPVWHDLAIRATKSPKIWMDAYLAAFAICAGLSLVTLDMGFRQYEGLHLKLLS